MKKKLLITTLTLTSLLLLGGCGQSNTVETTATIEETAEAAEAEVTPAPEPTVEPTPEPTPAPVVELADDEVIPAVEVALGKVKHYMINRITSGGSSESYNQIACDFDAGTAATINSDFLSRYCNGIVVTKKDDTYKGYALCDNGKSFDYSEVVPDQNQFTWDAGGAINELESTSFFDNESDKYHVAHGWTNDNVSEDDYYLIERYDADPSEDGSEATTAIYHAYYINKSTLLPDYYTGLIYYNFDSENSIIERDEAGNVIAINSAPAITSTDEFIYFDDEASQTGDDYDTYIYMTTIPSEDQLLTGDDLQSYLTTYKEAHPEYFD